MLAHRMVVGMYTYDVYVANATSKEGVRVPVPAMFYRDC